MTYIELIRIMNDTFGIGEWPKTYEVDAETYVSCCNIVFEKAERIHVIVGENIIHRIKISVGPNNGIYFKNVELIVRT